LLRRGLRRVTLDLQNAIIGVNRFDCSFNEASIAAKALVKAAPAPYFDGAIASEMSASASNEARGVTVWA